MTSLYSRNGNRGHSEAFSRKSITPMRTGAADPLPLPIARRPSISASTTGSVTGSASTSMLARPSTNSGNTTKSYVSSKPSKGVPIFVGSGSHTHAQARSATPLSIRRSQTPQVVNQRQSVTRELAPPVISSRSTQEQQKKAVEKENEVTPRMSTRIQTRNSNIRRSESEAAQQQDLNDENDHLVVNPPSLTSQGKQRAIIRKPANAPSAYVLFSKEARPRIINEAGSLEGARFNVNERVKEEWLALPEEEKERFRDEAAQRKQVWRSLMSDWELANPEEASRGRGISVAPTPSKSAMLLFADQFLTTTSSTEADVEQAWLALGPGERSRYESEAQEAEEEYLAEKEEWDKQSVSRKNRKSKRQTVSDDEAEYLIEVDRHGPALKTRRADIMNTHMSDLSSIVYKKGRASKRTFDMERKLKSSVRERQRVLNERRLARLKGESVEDEEETEERSAASLALETQATSEADANPEDEEIIDDGAESDAESLGAASEAMPPLRDNRFTVRTRIVNGQLVLDESSLEQSRNNEVDLNGAGQDFLDVNEEDRFVNSSTYSKRVGTDRWDAQETQAFLRAVSMWGSDFEMISRMFTNRNRKQIKAKWRSMERLDSRSLDLAFRRKLPVDLGEYGRMAGVDLSGDPPKIEARIIKKAEEGDEEQQDEDLQQQQEGDIVDNQVERDEQGRIIIDEGDEDPRYRSKKSATPLRMAKSKSPSVGADIDGGDQVDEEDEELPSAREAVRLATSNHSRKERATSTTSNASHRPRGGSSSGGANSSTAEVERLRLEKKRKDEQRRERERLRRRSVPTNEEEVVEERAE